MTAVTGPASSQPGQTFNATATVCNQGTQATPSTGLALYLSQDTVITPSTSPGQGPDLSVGAASLGALAPGGCQTVTLPVSYSPQEGIWYLGAVVDVGNTVPEFFEDNNSRASSRVAIGNRPDYVVTSITGPASVQRGQPFSASVRVCNQGTMAGGTDVAVYLSEDSVITPATPTHPGPDFLAGSGPTGPLAPGSCLTMTVNAVSSTSLTGAFNLGASVDAYGNAGNELLEDNNTRVGGRITVN
ncbi:CARDB domain-containing protein [Pyxidicoccus sp. 3LFB2]